MATMPAINRYQPIFARKGATTVKRDLNPIIEQVRNLLALTKATGFQTNRSIGALLKDLSPDELAQVSAALNLNNQR